MKVMFHRGELQEALSGLQRVIPGRATLPILQSVRFSVVQDQLTAAATDLDQTAVYRFQSAKVSNRVGTAIIEGSRLKTLAKGAAAEDIEIEATGKEITLTNTIAGQQVPSKLRNPEADEWPPQPSEIPTAPVDPAFLENLRKVMPFATEDESRPILQSVFMDVSQPDHYLVATDGRRMTCLNTLTFPIPESCIIPTTKFLGWNKLAGPVGIGFAKDKKLFHLEAGPWSYFTRLVEGQFPNWRQVLPTATAQRRMMLGEEDAAMLKKVLPTFPGHDTSNGLIKFTGAPGRLTLSGQSPDTSDWTTLELQHSRYEGDPGQIGVNRWFLLDALAAGFRSFDFENDMNPLHAVDDHGGQHVLMPLRLGEDKAPAAEGKAPGDEQPPASAPATPEQSETPRPAKTEPKKEKTTMPKTDKEATALDKLLAACEGAKAKLKEANDAVTEILSAAKDVGREDKQRRTEIEQVRAGLAKLQTIKV